MKVDINELFELVKVPGVSGYEKPIAEYLKSKTEALGFDTKVDALGNVWVNVQGNGKSRYVLAAHMDELGLVVSKITDDGFLKFKKIGGIDDRVLPSTHVIIHGEKEPVEGVITMIPPHLRIKAEETNKALEWHELMIDVGANSRKEVEELGIRISNPITFKKTLTLLKNNRFSTRGLDDRTGCYILMKILERFSRETPDADLTVIFTVREEVGLHGALAASKILGEIDLAIAIDTTNATDYPGLPDVYSGTLKLGEGPALRLVDRAFTATWKAREFVENVAKEHAIKYQPLVTGGGTDAMALGLYGGPRNSIAICIPTRYTHSLVEVEQKDDIEETIKLIENIANTKYS
ncbi:MAG: M42 family peptidase [Euryarchaeota archaeon]|nr:M42 family peptidase [Euryarchaeota archaeon]